MRDLKFRLRIDNKIVGYEKWYCGVREGVCLAEPHWLYLKDNRCWNPQYIYHTHKDQFIGLKDKNNVEIFEGDIVRHQITKIPTDTWLNRKVYFTNGLFCLSHKNSSAVLGNIHHTRLEVIGNIYEHGELLK